MSNTDQIDLTGIRGWDYERPFGWFLKTWELARQQSTLVFHRASAAAAETQEHEHVADMLEHRLLKRFLDGPGRPLFDKLEKIRKRRSELSEKIARLCSEVAAAEADVMAEGAMSVLEKSAIEIQTAESLDSKLLLAECESFDACAAAFKQFAESEQASKLAQLRTQRMEVIHAIGNAVDLYIDELRSVDKGARRVANFNFNSPPPHFGSRPTPAAWKPQGQFDPSKFQSGMPSSEPVNG